MNSDELGIKFLDRIYRDLYASDEVMHVSLQSDSKEERIRKFLARLERVNKLAKTDHKKELLRELYYEKYVIKESDVPYYNSDIIINQQKRSLDNWINYLIDDTTPYPMWAKYWAFQGMLKMGNFDEDSKTYMKRSKKTINPFMELNREFVSKAISSVTSKLQGKKLDDEELDKLCSDGNFSKIYSHLISVSKDKQVLLDPLDGIWIKYDQEEYYDDEYEDDDEYESSYFYEKEIPSYKKLCDSLQGYNTGWCTAGEEVAKSQLAEGDFYVYYTKDYEGNYVVPRIAIRMEDGSIGEIRGVDVSQNVEDGLVSVVSEKLNDLRYYDVISNDELIENMCTLSNIRINSRLYYKNFYSSEELTRDELYYVYNIRYSLSEDENEYIMDEEEDINYNFGYVDDPKIEKILLSRNYEKDFKLVEDKYKPKFLSKIVSLNGDFRFIRDIDNEELLFKAIKLNNDVVKYINPLMLKNRDFVKKMVSHSGFVVKNLDENVRNDLEIMKIAIKQNYNVARFIGENLLNDEEALIEFIKCNKYCFSYIPDDKKSRRLIDMAIEEKSCSLDSLPEQYLFDRNLILKILSYNAYGFSKLSSDFRSDREICKLAIKKDATNYKDINFSLKNDIELIELALKSKGEIFEYIPEKLKNKENILLAINSCSEYYLEKKVLVYIPKKLLEDEDIIFAIGKRNSKLLEKYIDKERKRSAEFLKKVVENGVQEISFFDMDLFADEDIILTIAKKINYEKFYNYISYKLLNDYDFLIKLAEIQPECIEKFYDKVFKDPVMIMKLNNISDKLIKFCPYYGYYSKDLLEENSFNVDRNYTLSVVRKYSYAYLNLKDEFKNDIDFILETLIRAPYLFLCIPKEHQLDRNLVLMVIKKIPDLYCELDQKLQLDLEIVKIVINKNWKILANVPTSLKKEKSIGYIAVRENVEAFDLLDSSLYEDKVFLLNAIAYNEKVLSKIDSKWLKDENFMYVVICKCNVSVNMIQKYIAPDLLDNINFVYKILLNNSAAFKIVDEKYFLNKKLMFKLITSGKVVDDVIFRYINKSLFNHKKFMMELIKYDKKYINRIGENLKNDKEFGQFLLEIDVNNYDILSSELKRDAELSFYAISKNPRLIRKVDKSLFSNKDFLKKIVSIDGKF